MTFKQKCKNPFCHNTFETTFMQHRLYCCRACQIIARDLRNKRKVGGDDFNKYRKGYIKLVNGMEVRNDAMGKEIADRMFV